MYECNGCFFYYKRLTSCALNFWNVKYREFFLFSHSSPPTTTRLILLLLPILQPPTRTERWVLILQKEFSKGQFYNQRETALIGADILVILVDVEEFYRATADEIRQTLKRFLIYDFARIFVPEDIQKSGLKLCQVGRGRLWQNNTGWQIHAV